MSQSENLAAAVAPLRRLGRLGVAVSGGSDSLALLHLLAAQGGPGLHVATVDHGLRPGSGAEAAEVARICKGMSLPHDRLVWSGWQGQGNLQDEARRARYRLLADWALKQGLDAVALGHTVDDQAETFLMRLARRSGVEGLSQMAGEFNRDGMQFLRPLLRCRRDDLRRYLNGKGQAWIDDPSNEDMRFDRVKARAALSALEPLGIGADELAEVAEHMAAAQQALQVQTVEALKQMVRSEAGDLVIERAGLRSLPAEIARRLIVAALNFVAPSDYGPRARPVSDVLDALADATTSTLHGCVITSRAQAVRISRELNAVQKDPIATDAIWDGRWRLSGPHGPDLHLAVLGEAGLAQCPDWRAADLPRQSLAVTPAVWRKDMLVAAPIAGKTEGWHAELHQSFDDYVNSLATH